MFGCCKPGDRLAPRPGSGRWRRSPAWAPARIILRAHDAVQADLPGLVDDAHAAAAQFAQDLVTFDRGEGPLPGSRRRFAGRPSDCPRPRGFRAKLTPARAERPCRGRRAASSSRGGGIGQVDRRLTGWGRRGIAPLRYLPARSPHEHGRAGPSGARRAVAAGGRGRPSTGMVSSSEDFGTPTDCSPGLTRLATGGASGSASPTRTPSRAVAESDRGERPRDRPCRAPIVPSRGSSNNAVRKCRVREFDFASRIHESCRTPRRLAAGRAEHFYTRTEQHASPPHEKHLFPAAPSTWLAIV